MWPRWSSFLACVITPTNQLPTDSPAPPKEEGDASHVKKRVVNNKVIIVEFLMNDLSFYLESERYDCNIAQCHKLSLCFRFFFFTFTLESPYASLCALVFWCSYKLLLCCRFRNLADAGTVMASAGMYGENDHAMLHQKADMMIKLFLKSEISPKLRVWQRSWDVSLLIFIFMLYCMLYCYWCIVYNHVYG